MMRTSHSLRILSAWCVALLLHAAVPHLHAPSNVAASARPLDGAVASTVAPSLDAALATAVAPSLDGALDSALEDRHAPERVATTAELSADDRHESHSSTRDGDEHPCALCRGPQGRLHATLAPTVFVLEVASSGLAARPVEIARAEQLFARRHPARAPPVA